MDVVKRFGAGLDLRRLNPQVDGQFLLGIGVVR
jgi:hypothetical protein